MVCVETDCHDSVQGDPIVRTAAIVVEYDELGV